MPNAFTWEEKIRVAKQAGFDFIEISIDESDERLNRLDYTKKQREELLHLLKTYDMNFESMCLSGHRRFPFGSSDDAIRLKAYEIMDKAIAFAVDLEIKNIQLAGYDVYYEPSDNATYKRFIEGLKYSADKAKESGVTLTIEIMDTFMCGTISRVLEIVKETKRDNILVYPDVGNLSQWTNYPEDELVKGFSYIEAIHLKDTLPGVFKSVPFGSGTVRFEMLFDTLTKLNYQKPFLIEMWANNSKEYTLEESVREISAAKKWLYNRM